MHTSDVVIAGAGIVGLSLGMELRRAGATVTVLDRGEPGREASSAAAGMLATEDPDTHPLLRSLIDASASMYPHYVEELELRSATKIGLEERGALYVAHQDEVFSRAPLTLEQTAKLEPNLANQARVYLLKERSVDPRRLVRAAALAARQMGVVIHHESPVEAVRLSLEHQLEIVTAHGMYGAATFVNCAGAWAASIPGASVPTRPVKGHMLAVIAPRCELRHVIRSRQVYLVPRRDSKVLIGSTLEDAGFDKTVNPSTVQQLHQAASTLVPAIGTANMIEAWAGLRPGSPDNLPILGPCHMPGTYAATGHFRNGIVLAPITALAMSELIQGKVPRVDLRPFAPGRFRTGQALAG